MASPSARSMGTRVAGAPEAARISSSSSSSPPWVRATAMTWAPAPARARAAARPMPRLAPVTRAILPSSGLVSDMAGSLAGRGSFVAPFGVALRDRRADHHLDLVEDHQRQQRDARGRAGEQDAR